MKIISRNQAPRELTPQELVEKAAFYINRELEAMADDYRSRLAHTESELLKTRAELADSKQSVLRVTEMLAEEDMDSWIRERNQQDYDRSFAKMYPEHVGKQDVRIYCGDKAKQAMQWGFGAPREIIGDTQ